MANCNPSLMEKTISAGRSPQNSSQGLTEPAQESALPCDDGAISPASRKVIEQYTIKIAPVQNKEIRSFITRPPSSGLESTGFQFAKPNITGRSFTARSQPNAQSSQADTVEPRLPESIKTSNAPEKSTPEQKENQNEEQSCGPAASPNAEKHSLSPSNGHTGYSKLIWAKPQLSQQGRSATNRESFLPCRTDDTKNNRSASTQLNRVQNSPAKAPSRSQNETTRARVGAGKTSSREKKPPVKAKSPLLSPSARVSKSPKPNINSGGPAPATRSHDGSGSHSQPSEEDLFYLLIHKLKKREETEAAATALREQLYAQLKEFKIANGKLRAQVKDIEQRYNKQESEKLTQRSIIERWKLKLDKLRNLITSIGGDQEAIRKDNERIRNEQASLNEEKQKMYDEIRHLTDNNNGIGKRLSQHKAQLSGIHYEFNSLEQSLLSSKEKITDRENALGRERNRVAVLEGYIRNQSNRIQKQSAEIHKSQLKTVTRLDSICERMDHNRDNADGILKLDVIPAIHACHEAVGSLSKKESLEPAHLVPIESSVEALSTQLKSHIQSIINDMKDSTSLQNGNLESIVSNLGDLKVAFQQNTQICNQLTQTEEVNISLRENLMRAEATLHSVTEECNSSKSQEVALKERIEELESQLSSSRNKLAEASNHEVNASEMQIQLEASSSALHEAKEEIMMKESAMCDMIGELDEAKKKLVAAEIEISRLEIDKRAIEEASHGAEQRIRQELTKASLMSKDQNRALFEQEKHKLERGKSAAEKQVTVLEKQIEMMKSNLARVNDENWELADTANQHKNGIEEVKGMHLKELSKLEAETTRLRQSEETLRRDRDSIQAKLVKALGENEDMNRKLENTRIASEQLSASLVAKEGEVSNKEEKLATLQHELQDAKKETGQISDLRLELAQYLQEIASLQEKLNLAMKREKGAAENLKSKETANGVTADLEDKANSQERRICELQEGLKEAETWPVEVRILLQEHGLVDENGSLVESMKILKRQLEAIRDRPRTEIAPEKPGQKVSRAARRKRKRTVSTTPKGKNTSRSTQECQTTELIFRTNSVVNTPSPHKSAVKNFTPKKKQTKPLPRIRPFSKIEWEPIDQRGSPVCLIPQSGKDHIVDVGGEHQVSHPTQSTALGQRPGNKEIPQEGKRVRTQDQLDREGEGSDNPCFENSKRRCIKNVADTINTQNNSPSQFVGESALQQGRRHSGEAGIAGKEADGQQGEAKPNAQKGPLKGILKDTTLPEIPARATGEARTPSLNVEAKRGSIPPVVAPRRQSRVSSRFFDPQLSPSPSLSIVSNNRETWTVKQSVDTFITKSRERNRRKRKGDLYDERFNQKFPA